MAKKGITPDENIAMQIIDAYKPKTAADMEEALKRVFAPMFEAALKGELDYHLGYDKNGHRPEGTTNSRNGYSKKVIKTSNGAIPISVPRDREGTFEPQIVKRYQRDVSPIEDKIITMYGRGMSQRDISKTIEDIYGFGVSAEQVSKITDRVMDEAHEWQNRPLLPFYTFLFIDCLYVSMRTDRALKQKAVYVILGYDADGNKEILGIWINETEGKHTWMQILDELKARGVQDVGFICMDGVSGLEEGVRAIFPGTVVQRCIVHLIRNSLRYLPWKERRAFVQDLKLIYKAVNVMEARRLFDKFKERWKAYPGAIAVWERNFQHVEQLFNYPSDVRRIMYTTNPIESVNSSLRKVTKKGSFPSDNAVLKALYLRVVELVKEKWKDNGRVAKWATVRNQLLLDDRIGPLMIKYEHFS